MRIEIKSADDAIDRLRATYPKQTELASEMRVSRSYVHSVIGSRVRPMTRKMLRLVGMDRVTVYLDEDTAKEVREWQAKNDLPSESGEE